MNELDQLTRNIQNISGENEVKLSELLTPNFISQCSNFNTVEDLFEANNLKINSEEDFEAIPDSELDTLIDYHTSYSSWQAMQQEAVMIYAKSKLFRGL